MSLYSIALFVHIAGAMLLVVLLAIEGLMLRTGGAARLNRILGPITLVAILASGFYMAAQIGWHAWTAVGLGAYALIAAGGAYTGISVVRGRMSSSTATISWLIRLGIAAGVVFDMTVKPELAGSVGAVVVAVVVALSAGLPVTRRMRVA